VADSLTEYVTQSDATPLHPILDEAVHIQHNTHQMLTAVIWHGGASKMWSSSGIEHLGLEQVLAIQTLMREPYYFISQ
jgi:hypothetical protein